MVKRKELPKIVSLILVLLLAAGVAAGCRESSADQFPLGRITGYSTDYRPKMGQPAPDFQFKTPGGEETSLKALRGKAVLLNFWATTCPVCVEEMPLIEKAHRDWGDKGLEVLAINLGEKGSTVSDFMRKNGYTFTVLQDNDLAVGYVYGVYYIPVSFLIDRDGIIQGIKAGAFADSAEIDAGVGRLISS